MPAAFQRQGQYLAIDASFSAASLLNRRRFIGCDASVEITIPETAGLQQGHLK
jgi:hypothetical protein